MKCLPAERLYSTMKGYAFYTYASVIKNSMTIKDILDHTFVLRFDKKTHKHDLVSMTRIEYIEDGNKRWNWNADPTPGEPVVFDTKEQEQEFFRYHPDAKYWKIFGSGTGGEIPIEKRNGRWCWKKKDT